MQRLAKEFWEEIDTDLASLAELRLLAEGSVPQARAAVTLLPPGEVRDESTVALVLEVVPEIREAKQLSLRRISERFAPVFAVASTTSSYLVAELPASQRRKKTS
ncbi:3-hydroxyacyl-CoA dehydrogenase NAD-binding domain-containing protein [Variovorax sp. E3]|uniref:3-hydroxyacyl-CoA dehydrogenase NAD-binding domain-containing protein n=1 Tax=Variovorax sp. E3 TaxID=1914993 RepID=UPI0035B05D98